MGKARSSRSSASAKAGERVASRDMPRFVSLNGGTGCYFRDPETGKTSRFADVASTKLVDRIAELAAHPAYDVVVAEASEMAELRGGAWNDLVAAIAATGAVADEELVDA